MRWVAGLVLLCLAMAWCHHLTAAAPLTARAALSLGFLLLVAWQGGALARALSLPQLTGFLLAAAAVGPAWLGLVRADELDQLTVFSTAAIACLAFAAGLAVPVALLRAQWRGLARIVVGTMGAPFLAVAAVVFSVGPWFPLTIHQGMRSALGVALVLGVWAAASSPVLISATLDELGIETAFTGTVLEVAAIEEIGGVVALALALIAASALARPGVVHVHVAAALVGRLGASLAAGAALGVLVGRYAEWTESPLAVVVAGAGVLALAERTLPIESAVAALAAGLVARGAMPEAASAVRAALRGVAFPVQATCFALAGAAWRLDALSELWPWVVLLVGLRVVALRYGAWWAGRRRGVSADVARHSWLGLVSQGSAAVALGAAARRAFPGWGVSFEALVGAGMALQQIVGPLCLRWVVRTSVGRSSDPSDVAGGALSLSGAPAGGS